jgi:hypothetical protein
MRGSCRLLPAGMTLYALPPDILVTDTTPPPLTGSSERATMLCSMLMHCATASTVSFVACGMAAWPPPPDIVTEKKPAAAKMGPEREAMTPEGKVGHMC